MTAKNPVRVYAGEFLGKGGLTEKQAASVAAAVVAATPAADPTGSVFGDVAGALLGPLFVKALHGDESSIVLAADADDLDLGDRSEAFYWLIDFAGFDISGFAAPATPGEAHVVINTGAAGQILASGAGSAAANRVLIPAGDLALETDGAAIILYSGTLERWVVLAGSPGAAGLPGMDGLPGAPGSAGAAGNEGLPGLDGQQGLRGLTGAAGVDGAPGMDGLDGQRGPIGALAEQDHGSVTGTENVDLSSKDVHRLTLGGNITLTVSGAAANPVPTMGKLLLIQPAAGGPYTVTWWAGINWKAGAPPTLSVAANAIDQVDVFYDSINSQWIGTVPGIVTGPQGIDGLAGMDGLTGNQGIQGIPGIDGLDGGQGLVGGAGVPGLDGLDGGPGPSGVAGVAGAAGAAGYTDKATATGVVTTGTGLADITGATLSVPSGKYLVIATFYAKVNTAANDRTFEGHLDVNGSDQTDIASMVPGANLVGDIIECTQQWVVTLAGTQTVKLRAKHSGGTIGTFDTQTTCVLTVIQASVATGVLATALFTGGAGADYTKTTGAFADVNSTDFALAITTGARRVLIGFNGTAYNSGANGTHWRVLIDGSSTGLPDPAGMNNYGSVIVGFVGFVIESPILSAGSHTFKLQWKVDGGTSTLRNSGEAVPQFWVHEIPDNAAAGGGALGILGVTEYVPGTQQVFSTTSATLADVDATNLAVTFTAPASGRVLVEATCWVDSNTSTQHGRLGIREATTDLGTPVMATRDVDNGYVVTAKWYLTGVAAGSHTYKLSFATDTGTFRVIVSTGASGAFPPAVLVVHAA